MASFAFAHSPKYSYIDIVKVNDKWKVSLNATYSAYISEFVSSSTKENVKNLKVKEFGKWIKNHIKNKLYIYDNNNKIDFSPIYVKLRHEVYATFHLLHISKNTRTFKVVNHMFKNIKDSQYILKINNKEAK